MKYLEEQKQALLSYRPNPTRQDDFDAFWQRNLSANKKVPLHPEKTPYPLPFPYAQGYQIQFFGIDHTAVHGWFLIPTFLPQKKLPCIIHYHGFTGSRGNPVDFAAFLLMGFCVLSVDCRSQGGLTGDQHAYQTGLVHNVCMQGVLDPGDYYFKFLYLDALRAIDFAAAQEVVDPARIILEGGSQGGALCLAAASLDPRPALALCDVPSNCEIQKRIERGEGSFSSVREFLKQYPDHTDAAMKTVSYFDLVNLADHIKCPVYASVGLLDNVCPAQYFFGAYNRMQCEKDVVIYPFNGHEGGGALHQERKLHNLHKFLTEQ